MAVKSHYCINYLTMVCPLVVFIRAITDEFARRLKSDVYLVF